MSKRKTPFLEAFKTVPRWTMGGIKRANKEGGYHFFERATMRFFDSRVESKPYQGAGGVYFITSEQFHGSTGSAPRKYTVRSFDPATGDIDSTTKFNEISDIQNARNTARLLASGKGLFPLGAQ